MSLNTYSPRIEWIPTVISGFGYGERWVIKGGYPFRVFKINDDLWDAVFCDSTGQLVDSISGSLKEAAAYVEQMYKASRQADPESGR